MSISDSSNKIADPPVLKIIGLHKWFSDNHILKGINLTVSQHQVVALIGASGSGKSTLMKTINLLEPIDDGQIFLSGEDISDPQVNSDSIRSRIGVVFQSYNLFPHMNVLDNVTLASRKVLHIDKKTAENTGMELLTRIGLKDKAKEYPDRLSGGQQQRVAIARAIATKPELLLLDEITSALDPQLVGEVLDLVKELKSSGSTILMATHEMSFAHRVADRVDFLYHGRLIESGSPAQIFENPAEKETKDFLSRINDPLD